MGKQEANNKRMGILLKHRPMHALHVMSAAKEHPPLPQVQNTPKERKTAPSYNETNVEKLPGTPLQNAELPE